MNKEIRNIDTFDWRKSEKTTGKIKLKDKEVAKVRRMVKGKGKGKSKLTAVKMEMGA